MGTVRIRKDVWKLADWDPILEWYARGIAEMQKRPLADPTSWRFQAAIHDYNRDLDPYADPEDILPSPTAQGRFWGQCQHNTWYFLPWHRMYLAYFEQIVARAVADLGGPADWSLPYWNYSDANNPDARRLPPAFRAELMPDGSPNPLFIEERQPDCNDGNIMADGFDVEVVTCLSDPSFVSQPMGGSPGFGGPKTGFNHGSGGTGKLERVPHGTMHMAVNGWMSRFYSAGLDPLFWLHHANIDRLWVVWRQRDPLHVDPTDPAWLTSLSFEFHDATGAIVSLTPAQVVETTMATPLDYEYEDVSDPLGEPPPEPVTPDEAVRGARRTDMSDRAIPEMVGATEGPVLLTGQPTTVHLPVTAPTGPASAARAAGAPPPEMYLNIENITGEGGPTSYAVYLNVPAGEDPQAHPELLAGILPMFGVAEASQESETHPGSGLHYALEVGEIVRRLEARNAWDPNDLQLTFVPRRRSVTRTRATGAAEPAAAPIQVGRVSLYIA